jgi:hypothetical protein
MIEATILDLVNADARSKVHRQARLLFGMPLQQGAAFLFGLDSMFLDIMGLGDLPMHEAIRIWLCKVFNREMNYPREWEEDKALSLLFCGATRAEYLRDCLCWKLGLSPEASDLQLRAACVADFRELVERSFLWHRETAPLSWSNWAYREPDPWEPRGAEHESFGDIMGLFANFPGKEG